MTRELEEQIRTMRINGMGYVRIARAIGISENTVRSFCRRNNLTGSDVKKPEYQTEHRCLYCGKPVMQNPGRKEKKFCSDECRMKWWGSHPDMIDRKATYDFICLCCGKPFTAYGNANRKYCSHECYVKDRFGR